MTLFPSMSFFLPRSCKNKRHCPSSSTCKNKTLDQTTFFFSLEHELGAKSKIHQLPQTENLQNSFPDTSTSTALHEYEEHKNHPIPNSKSCCQRTIYYSFSKHISPYTGICTLTYAAKYKNASLIEQNMGFLNS